MVRSRWGAAAAVLVIAVSSSVAVVAASGVTAPDAPTSVTGAGSGLIRPFAKAGVDLCQIASIVTRVNVTRSKPLNAERFSFPARVTVTKVADVRAAARALCALPTMPAGVVSCPADLGVDYTLRFSAAAEAAEPVTLDVSGCETVRGLGTSRWVARSPNFWREFGSALGLHAATRATFVGTLTSSGS